MKKTRMPVLEEPLNLNGLVTGNLGGMGTRFNGRQVMTSTEAGRYL